MVLSKCRQGKRYDDVRCEVRPSSTMTPFRLSEHFPADVFSSLLIFLLTANLSFESEPFSVEEIPIAWSLFAGRSQDERHVTRRLRCGGQGKSRLQFKVTSSNTRALEHHVGAGRCMPANCLIGP